MLCPVCNAQNDPSTSLCPICCTPLRSETPRPCRYGLPIGAKLRDGAFTVGKVLGQGGYGITYMGSDTRLGRPVAIKEFFPQGSAREGTGLSRTGPLNTVQYRQALDRFLDEARILAQFKHHGIVHVYASFEENNTAYMVMEFLKGRTLHHLLDERGFLPECEAVEMIDRVGQVLAMVHDAGLLHRDVKPENVMVTDSGRVVLVDFGSAREFNAGRTKRMTAMLTPGYAPLEQYGREAKFGVFTDVYALGATLYHLLTGQAPCPATDRASGVELTPPRRLNPEVSSKISDAILWAMQMAVRDRPQSVEEFLSALRGQIQPKTPQSPVAAAHPPFKFKGGEAHTLRELVRLCDLFRSEAECYLHQGYFERWLASIGEAALAQKARQWVDDTPSQQSKNLEFFIRELCRAAGVNPFPRLIAVPAEIDLGELPAGATAKTSVRFQNEGRGVAWGSVLIDPRLHGMTATADTFESFHSHIDLELDTLNLLPGVYEGHVVLQPEGVPFACRIPIRYRVMPFVLNVYPSYLPLGKLPYGEVYSYALRLTSEPGGGRIQGAATLNPPLEGVRLEGTMDGSECELRLHIDTRGMTSGRRSKTILQIESNGGDYKIPIRFYTALRRDILTRWVAGSAAVAGMGLGLSRALLDSVDWQPGQWALTWPDPTNLQSGDASIALASVLSGMMFLGLATGFIRSQGRLRQKAITLYAKTVGALWKALISCGFFGGIVAVLLALVAGVAGLAGTACLGGFLLLFLGFLAHSVDGLGIQTAVDRWILLGCALGGGIGFIRGLQLSGRRVDLPKVYGGAVVLGVALMLSAALQTQSRWPTALAQLLHPPAAREQTAALRTNRFFSSFFRD